MLEAKRVAYRKAYTELNEIFKFLPTEQLKKIPAKLRKNIKAEMDNEYNFKIDPSKTLEEQELMAETKALIVELYERYLCEDEEKDRWEIYDKFCLDKIEEKKKERFDPDNVFKNSDESKNEEDEHYEWNIEEKSLTEIEHLGFFGRIIQRIKRLLK